MVDVHIEGLNELVADLTNAPRKVQLGARAVIEKGAHNIKSDARRLAPSGPQLPTYADSISYDVKGGLTGEIEAEIGPDKERSQGPLGNILEYGTSKTPPYAHLGPAFDMEQPKFTKALEDLGEEALS